MLTRLFIAFCLLAGWAAAEPRIALVIGNGAYRSAALANPPSDARLAADALTAAGFDTEQVIDAGRDEMKRAIRGFADRLRRAGPSAVAAFFYAGHGVQAEGRNYLIPVGAPIETQADLDYEAVEAQWVLDLIGDAGPNLSVIILDACRNNPFRSLSRAASRGLARMDAPRGSLLAYSTAPGEVASDGSGGNSPFTAALAEAIRTPGLKIEDVFKQTRRAVLAATGGRQTPWESSSLTGDFYFTPGAGPAPVQPVMAAPSRRPGDIFTDCPDCPEMVALAGGASTIGSPPSEPGREAHEGPVVTVTLRPFALAREEVSRGDYARFLAETGREPAEGCWHLFGVWLFDGARNWRNTGYPQRDDHPAVCVRWSDAVAYADWMSQRAGQRYRLPSEAEWEYAARPAPWDFAEEACRYDNVHDATANATWGSGAVFAVAPCDDGSAATMPNRSYAEDGRRLFDMLGNVAEWTADCWNDSHKGRPADGAPRRDGHCANRVVKGSSFLTPAALIRPAFRFNAIAEYPNIYLGFRLARDLN